MHSYIHTIGTYIHRNIRTYVHTHTIYIRIYTYTYPFLLKGNSYESVEFLLQVAKRVQEEWMRPKVGQATEDCHVTLPLRP